MKKRFLIFCIFALLPVALPACAHRKAAPAAEVSSTGEADKVDLAADYDCRIIGKYRFNRSSSRRHSIYTHSDVFDDAPRVTLVSGTIDKYMHDGERYIAYHLSDPDTEDGEGYYAILDTQTEETERFDNIETLSDAVQARGIRFGNWFYPAAGHSIEGVRTPLFGDYAFEEISSVRGQSVLLRETPVFHGILDDVMWDGERYIAFRQRIVRYGNGNVYIGYDDPTTNQLLSALSDKRIGIYRHGFLEWSFVYYDQYVLFDTETQQVVEMGKEKMLRRYCEMNGISLTNRLPESNGDRIFK